MSFSLRNGADESAAVVIFAGLLVLQTGFGFSKSLAAVGRSVKRTHAAHDVERFRIHGVCDNAGIVCLRSGFNSGPAGTIVVGTIDCCALVWAVQHHLAVSRKYHQALRALERGLHAVPGLAHVVAAVHHVEVLRIVLAVNGNHAGAHQTSGERSVTHAFGRADGRFVALGALLDVRIDCAVVVANGGD